MGFPQLGNIDKRIYDTINAKAGKNLRASQTMPWIRVTSCLGNFLSMQSSKSSETFVDRYGDTGKSGRVGIEYPGGKPKSLHVKPDRGLRPSPTIDSISISQGNEGLSKKSSFTITCYSLAQCEKVMEYFLEPGNMVLVEWGENNNLSWGQRAGIDKCSIAAYNSLKVVQTKRKAAHGMYDAVLGVITGGGMSYGSNESFEIQVELTSIGELPAYLQHHKGIPTNLKKNDGSKLFRSFNITGEKHIGKRLFYQMYNDLPSHKRTDTIKNLRYHPSGFATDAINFINMDKQIRVDLVKSTKEAVLITKSGNKDEIASDMPLFSDKRYIRVALAFSILDLCEDVDLVPTPLNCGQTGKGPKGNTSNGKIVWKNTICRAHKNMFSADSNYLYIPNKNAPAFDLVGSLNNKESDVKPLPDLSEMNLQLSPDKTADLHPKAYDSSNTDGHSYFPSLKALDLKDQAEYDGSYVNLVSDAGKWGYLRDLYINFDFFCDVLDKKGLVTKDVYYELLNGLSSGVNLYWNFQIIPRGSINMHTDNGIDADSYYKYQNTEEAGCNTGAEELQVVDASFGGKMSKGSSVGLARFQSRGTTTPFLTAELNFDIPGAMKGQVIGSKLAGNDRVNNNSSTGCASENPQPEIQELRLDGLFTNKMDTVLKELNSVKKKSALQQKEIEDNNKFKGKSESQIAQIKRNEKKQADKDALSAEEEQKKANYENFVSNALIIPKEQDRDKNYDVTNQYGQLLEYTGDNTTIDELAVVGAWNDSSILKKVQMLNEGLLGNGKSDIGQLNVPLLPIKFNFTIHGVSGIRVGDTFNITDLPGKYKTKVFQVTQVAHDITQSIWTTKIEGSMRNMEAGTGDIKKYA